MSPWRACVQPRRRRPSCTTASTAAARPPEPGSCSHRRPRGRGCSGPSPCASSPSGGPPPPLGDQRVGGGVTAPPRLPSGVRGWVVGPWCWALLGRPLLSLCPAGPLGVGPGTQFSSDQFYEHLFCVRSVVCAKTPSKNITVLLAQSYPTLCHPMDYNPSGSSVHGILQVRILEQAATSFSRGSSPSRNRTQLCIAGRFFTD